jgi:hypothetical protein
MEAGSNTSTVALREVGGDEKGTQCLGHNWAILFLGDLALQVGGVSSLGQYVKYGHESGGTRTRERLRWRGLATVVNDRPIL